MFDLETIRTTISLPALAEEAGAHFDNPHRLTSRCPLPKHTGDRSSQAFTIFDNGRRWKCHSSCPAEANGGDVFAFYMAWKGVDFKTAVSELAERARVAPTAQVAAFKNDPIPAAPVAPDPAWRARAEQFIAWAEGNLASHAGAQEYLEKERGLSPDTWRAFRLGYNPTNLYDDPARWGLAGKKIWLPRGLVIPGFWQKDPSYVKIRRPLPDQALGEYIGAWQAQDGLPEVKFGGPRGGVTCLFRLELLSHYPILVLTEGEWDAMLLWEYCPDLCDVGTLGGATTKLDTLDLALLTSYLAVLVIHDADQAGEQGRQYFSELHARFPRMHSIQPPAHDLTDFWKAGEDLRAWLAGQISEVLENTLKGMTANSPKLADWQRLAWLARAEAR
jgi:5S rRNA maturation endonuclease (ribonuclease M5)